MRKQSAEVCEELRNQLVEKEKESTRLAAALGKALDGLHGCSKLPDPQKLHPVEEMVHQTTPQLAKRLLRMAETGETENWLIVLREAATRLRILHACLPSV